MLDEVRMREADLRKRCAGTEPEFLPDGFSVGIRKDLPQNSRRDRLSQKLALPAVMDWIEGFLPVNS